MFRSLSILPLAVLMAIRRAKDRFPVGRPCEAAVIVGTVGHLSGRTAAGADDEHLQMPVRQVALPLLLARVYLWQAGLDYDHGTGHGVGSYLSVHEGPARIAKLGTVALKRGMTLSNEPGYYRAGAYGIRIENLVLVIEAAPVAGAEKPLNAFETLTLAPIDRRLVLRELLTDEETLWLDRYHAHVADTLGPLLDNQSRAWLIDATRPLG